MVSRVRRFVASFFGRMLSDREGIDRVALATHELLENAIQYCHGGETQLEIGIFEADAKLLVVIKTKNRAGAEDAEVLRRTLDELSAAGDPFEKYQEAMRRSLQEHDTSRLGLARLHAEAGVTMMVETEPDGSLALVASTFVELEDLS